MNEAVVRGEQRQRRAQGAAHAVRGELDDHAVGGLDVRVADEAAAAHRREHGDTGGLELADRGIDVVDVDPDVRHAEARRVRAVAHGWRRCGGETRREGADDDELTAEEQELVHAALRVEEVAEVLGPEVALIEGERHRRIRGVDVNVIEGGDAHPWSMAPKRRHPWHAEDVITLYGFKSIFEGGVGETKDLRAQWALEEIGLPYRVHALDQVAGDLDSEMYRRISPFRQVPVIDDDGFIVAESAAVVLYLAEKAGRLIPADVQGRTRVTQWCFAAVATVDPTFACLDMVGIFDPGNTKLEGEVRKLAHRWLGSVEHRLEGRTWIACDEFTVADIMMAGVLRGVRKTDLLAPFPAIRSYYDRCFARPAWERTLGMYADRFGISADAIR